MKLFIRVFFVSFFFIVTSPASSAITPVTQKTISPPIVAETVSAFRQYIAIDGLPIVVPTVVEVPISSGSLEHYEAAVLNSASGALAPYYFQQEVRMNEQSLSAASSQTTAPYALVDKHSLTYAEFLLPETGEEGRAVITLTSPEPITTSSLTVTLDNYVALPTSIEIRAVTDVGSTIVVAKRAMPGTTITFPRTSAKSWNVTFTHSQPLRISELAFQQENALVTRSRGIRFLAQPGASYRVYFDSDRRVDVTLPESGNLRSDLDVLALPQSASIPNPQYVMADIDKDGVPDTLDNCVEIANPAQEDRNNNKRGDACEDFDRDGILNPQDNCPDHPNVNQADSDGDGIGDLCDNEESRITERYTWLPWLGIGSALIVLIVLFAMTARSVSKGTGAKG